VLSSSENPKTTSSHTRTTNLTGNAYRNLTAKLLGKETLGKEGGDRRLKLRWLLRKYVVSAGVGRRRLLWWLMLGFLINGAEFFNF
jgi:hypothetical protein